ncbi:uncharacterized protein LOC117250826 [Xyrichtys novacula]|uniref:Uncharacterized protein LOC117250826 n=1 Tax=Xyrichtys novacula TaxID=13765 RepID=A0AAV1F9L5_XYRNO|nr:uncharacterized protein LOC117250826 [Xyrichtys novacula]
MRQIVGCQPPIKSNKKKKKICPGQWTEKTGRDLEGFPSQDFGSGCGIFMLMSAMYIVMESQFDYSVVSTFQHAVSSSRLYFVLCTKMKYKQQFQHDMPVLRRWWCLLLLENNSLNSYGKIFAHWTKECQELIAGKHTPVFRLKRKAEQQDTEETMTQTTSDVQRVCMADSMNFCVYQTSDNTGERLLYPEGKFVKWVQCETCRG